MLSSKITKELQQKVFELTLALYRVTDFFPQSEALRKHLREKANEIFGAISEFNFSLEPDRNALFLTAKIEAMKGYLALARSMRFVKPINLSILEKEYVSLLQFFTPLDTENSDFSLDGIRTSSRESSRTMMSEVESQTRDEGDNSQIVDKSPLTRGEDQIELVQETKEAEVVMAEEVPHDLPKWDDFTAKDKAETKFEEHASPHINEAKESKEPARAPYKDGLSSISYDMNERQKKILEHIRNSTEAKISDFYSVFSEISSKTIQRDLQDLVVKNVLKKEGDKRWTIYSLNMSDSI